MNFRLLISKCLGVKGTKFVNWLISPNQLRINKNGKSFLVYSKRNYPFWREFKKGNWEPDTYVIFDKFLDEQHSCIDIGSWIGPTVLYACQLAKHCYAVEPDPIAFDELKKNVELNKVLLPRITLNNLAISISSGSLNIYQAADSWGNSGTSTLFDKTKSLNVVNSKTFQQFLIDNSIDDCNFIKMDIEGAEFAVLPTMIDYLKTNKPTLLLELHPMFVNDPIQKLVDIEDIVKIYDNMYDEKFNKIDFESLKLSFKVHPVNTLRVTLTTLS